MRSILVKSGCEDVRIDDDPMGCLSEHEVQDQVSEYLGPENDVAFQTALEQMKETIQRLTCVFAALVPDVEVCYNLLRWPKADQSIRIQPTYSRLLR